MSTNASEAGRNQWFDGRFLQRDIVDRAGNVALVRSGERLDDTAASATAEAANVNATSVFELHSTQGQSEPEACEQIVNLGFVQFLQHRAFTLLRLFAPC